MNLTIKLILKLCTNGNITCSILAKMYSEFADDTALKAYFSYQLHSIPSQFTHWRLNYHHLCSLPSLTFSISNCKCARKRCAVNQ